jgi:hypothetical protein
MTLAATAAMLSLWRATQGYQRSTAVFIGNIAVICFNIGEVFTASLLLVIGVTVYIVELVREERVENE